MNRRGISGVLLMVVALVPLVLVIDFALLFVSFPNALEYVVAIDVPVFPAILAVVFLSRRRRASKERVVVSPATAMDKLRERNGGRRAPTAARETLRMQEAEKEEAEVFLEGTDAEKSAQAVDQTLQRMKAKEMDLGVAPIAEIEGREQSEIAEPEEPTKALQKTKAKEMDLGVAPIPEVEAREQLAVEPKLPVNQPTPEKAPKPNVKTKNYSLSPDKLEVPAFICSCGHAHRFVCLTCGMTAEIAAKKSKTHWVEWVPEMETAS